MNEVDPLDPFRCHDCPECGYSLRGLDRPALCPECGGDVGPDVLVVWGFPLPIQRRTHFTETPQQELRSAVLIGSGMAGVGLVTFVSGHGIGLLFSAIGLAVVGAGLYRRRAHQTRGGSHQLRITPAGFGGRRGLGPVKLRPWRAGLIVTLQHGSPDAASLVFGRRRVAAGTDGMRFRADFDATVALVRHIRSLIPATPTK